MSAINNDKEVLPYHRICIHLSFNANNRDAVAGVFNHVLSEESVVALIDMSWSSMSHVLQPILQHVSVPVINIRKAMKLGFDLSLIKQTTTSHHNPTLQNGLFYYMSSGMTEMFEAFDAVALHYGWKIVGLLISEEHYHEHNPEFCSSFLQLKHTR